MTAEEFLSSYGHHIRLKDNPVEFATARGVAESIESVLSEFQSQMGLDFGRSMTLRHLDRPPYLHAQSLGFVAGMTEHCDPRDPQFLKEVDPTDGLTGEKWVSTELAGEISARGCEVSSFPGMPESPSNVFGVSLHPRYGGWFVFRYLLVINGVRLTTPLKQPEPLSFLTPQQKRHALLEYNTNHAIGHWRDLKDERQTSSTTGEEEATTTLTPNTRYSAEAYLFFHTRDPAVRRRFLELKTEELRKC
eukprot:Selendium_serpulae@DN6826_c0_g1_i1.p1